MNRLEGGATMMTLQVAALLVAGVVGWVLANVDVLVPRAVFEERLVRTRWDTRLPRASASIHFAERYRRRALIGAAVSAALAVGMVGVLGTSLPTVNTVQLAVLLVAAAGSSATRALLTGVEALRASRTDAPRVARGWTPTLTDYVWIWPAGVLAVGAVAYLAVVLPDALVGEYRIWALAWAVFSALVTLGGWTLAWWLPRQPHLAHTPDDLKWNDWERGSSLSALLFLGPASVVMVGAAREPDPPLGLFFAVLLAAIAALSWSQRRRYLTRLWPGDAASENGITPGARAGVEGGAGAQR